MKLTNNTVNKKASGSGYCISEHFLLFCGVFSYIPVGNRKMS